jgi:exosortase A
MKKLNNLWLLMGLILAIPALFYGTAASMIRVWTVNETFTHGYLVFPISLWLIWRERFRINELSARTELIPVLLMVPILLVWMLSAVSDVKVVEQLAMITLIPLAVWAILGWRILLAVLFPLAYLLFAVPLGQELIPPLMDFTANFTVGLIKLSGIPVYQDGLYFTLPSGNWSVVEECSGVRYLIASLALGTIYAYLNYHHLYKRSIFILFAIAVPIFANGLRAYMIVMIGHLSGMKYAVGADHLLYGWVFFGIVIFLMFYIGSFWSDPNPTLESGDKRSSTSSPALRKFNPYILAITIALPLGTKLITAQILAPPTDNFVPGYVLAPEELGHLKKVDSIEFDWKPIFTNPDSELAAVYRDTADALRLDIGYYRYQRSGSEAVSSLNRLTNPYGGDWKIIASRNRKDDGISVNETEVQKNNQKVLVWHWYRVGDKSVANPMQAKFSQLAAQLFSARRDASMITLSTDIGDDVASARARLKQFKTLLDQNIVQDH